MEVAAMTDHNDGDGLFMLILFVGVLWMLGGLLR